MFTVPVLLKGKPPGIVAVPAPRLMNVPALLNALDEALNASWPPPVQTNVAPASFSIGALEPNEANKPCPL